MTANRSLDEFAAAGAESAEDGEGGADDDGTETAPTIVEDGDPAAPERASETPAPGTPASPVEAAEADEGTPTPPESTYVWRPDGGACGACGETVEERWRDRDALVCAGCKEW